MRFLSSMERMRPVTNSMPTASAPPPPATTPEPVATSPSPVPTGPVEMAPVPNGYVGTKINVAA